MTSTRKTTALIILDGWGHRDPAEDNAISKASTPFWDKAWAEQPKTLINTSGMFVGLPQGQMGNSEVGHLNLGAGRIVYQDIARVDRAIAEGTFAERLGLDALVERVRSKAPARLIAERDRLRAAIRELTDGAGIDEDRLAREVAMLAERWDISVELVRLKAHIDLFRSLLEADSAEPVGKRLSFVVQEMLREANTIGSKANDAAIEHEVVSIKNEIERLREQADNVE